MQAYQSKDQKTVATATTTATSGVVNTITTPAKTQIFNLQTQLTALNDFKLITLDLSQQRVHDEKAPLKNLNGHTEYVTALAVLTDGRLASGSADKSIKLWDIKTERCVATLQGHNNAISALAALPDGRLASSEYTLAGIKLWDTKVGQCVTTLQGHSGEGQLTLTVLSNKNLVSVAYLTTPNHKLYCEIKQWELKTGRCISTILCDNSTSYNELIAVLADGRFARVSEDGRGINLWDSSMTKYVATSQKHSNNITSIKALSDGRLASASTFGDTKLWDTKNGKCLATLPTNSYDNYIVALVDGRLAVSETTGKIKLWDAKSTKEQTLIGQDNYSHLAALADGRLVSSTSHGSIKLWDPKAGKCTATLHGTTSYAKTLKALIDEQIVSDPVESAKLWNLGTRVLRLKDIVPLLVALPGSSIKQLNLQNCSLEDSELAELLKLLSATQLTDIDLSYASITWQGVKILLESLAQHSSLKLLQHEALPIIKAVSVLFAEQALTIMQTPADQQTARAAIAENINLIHQAAERGDSFALNVLGHCYEIGLGAPINHQLAIYWYRQAAQQKHAEAINNLARLQEQLLLQNKIMIPHAFDAKATLTEITQQTATVIDFSNKIVWDKTAKPKTIQELKGHGKEAIKILVAVPNAQLASLALNGQIKIWHADNGQCLSTLEHKDATKLTALPNNMLASGALDGTIKIWLLATKQNQHTLVGHKKAVTDLVTLPDGRLVSCSADGTIKLWNINDGQCERTLKTIGDTGNEIFDALILLPNGYLASASSIDNQIKIWNVQTGQLVQALKKHQQRIITFAILANGNLTSFSEREFGLWNIFTGECINFISNDKSKDKFQAVNQFTEECLVTTSNGMINLLDLRTNQTTSFKAHSDAVASVAVLPGNRLASVSGDKRLLGESTIKCWDVGMRRLRLKDLEEIFIALQTNHSVQQLNLRYVVLTDKDIPVFAELLSANNTIMQLDLRRTSISTQGIQQLENMIKARATKLTILRDEQAVNIVDSKDQKTSLTQTGIPSSNANTATAAAGTASMSSAVAIAPPTMATSSVNAVAVPTQNTPITTSFIINFADLKIDKELGRGGFGVVHQGTWRFNPVAIKQLLVANPTADSLEEFKAETQIMAKLRSPNIVQFYGACLGNPQYCIVMEYMPKGSLFNVLHSKENLAWETRYRLITEIACGVAFLHAENIFHRDLKSLNVLLDENSHAKLTDFGLSKIKNETKTTTKGGSAGTPAWMAPELFERKAIYTQKSDVYSLGITFWEVAARKIPFADAHNPSVIPTWVMRGDREDIPKDCPPKLASLIKFCWDGDQAKRPTAARVVEFLRSDEKEFTAASAVSASVSAAASSYQSNLNSQSPNSAAVSYQGNLNSGPPTLVNK